MHLLTLNIVDVNLQILGTHTDVWEIGNSVYILRSSKMNGISLIKTSDSGDDARFLTLSESLSPSPQGCLEGSPNMLYLSFLELVR